MTATATVSKTIDASKGDVWKALSSLETMQRVFFGAAVETTWEVGSPIRFHGEFKGTKFEDKGQILSFDANVQLSFSQWSSMSGRPDTPENYEVITFDLNGQGDRTDVTLTRSNLTGDVTDVDREKRNEYEGTLRAILDGLDQAVTR